MKEEKILEKIYEHSKPYLKLMSYYKCAMMEIETKFNVLNEQYSLEKDRNPISSIKTRLKSALSIEEKLKRRCFENTLEAIENNLYDVAGIRVICNLPEDVYALAEAFLKQDDVKLIQMKDYIKKPKENGYRSLHLLVEIPIFLANEKKIMKAEIQLRTIAMDFWASLEHQLRYKKDGEFTEEIAKELYECAETSAQLDLKMQNVRRKIENS